MRMATLKVTLLYFLYMAEAHLSSGQAAISITRHHNGDIFTAEGEKCYMDICTGLDNELSGNNEGGECECKCDQNVPVYRDDLNICVDDIQECSLVPFVSGTTIKKIPYVFLPLKGQIVYPSADIVVSEIGAPVCVVSGGQFLGRNGWVNLRNNSAIEPPFRLFRDEGRTYLQWFGESPLRMAMEGRIILVHLMCKDANVAEEPKIFTPCLAFRVAGNPSAREVLFATDVQLAEGTGGSLSIREYVAIGLCSLFLAVVYIASVFLYLHRRKQKQKNDSLTNNKDAQITLGEEGIVKSNPLLQANRHLVVCGEDNAGYVTDSNSCCSDPDQISDLLCLDEDLTLPQNVQTSAIIHPCNLEYGETILNTDPNSIERLPEENVSIVETLEAKEGHPETLKTIVSSNGRRKLYFNPSYFEPELLRAPPPAALEFLIKIREVIAIAKHKMSNKKFSPSLLGIPEEDGSSRTESNHLPQNSSIDDEKVGHSDIKKPVVNNKSEKQTEFHLRAAEFCCPSDVKQRIIQKWLEDVPVMPVQGDQRSKLSSSIKYTDEDKALEKPNFWKTNEDTNENGSQKKQSSAETTVCANKEKKRPSTKSRPPPVPPQQISKQPQANENLKAKDKSETSGSVQRQKTTISHSKTSHTTSEQEICQDFTNTSINSLSECNDEEVSEVGQKKSSRGNATKNLMDAVIQELSCRKNEKTMKISDQSPASATREPTTAIVNNVDKESAFKLHSNSDENPREDIKEVENNNNNNTNSKSTKEKALDTYGKSPGEEIQDEHEYEVILLNPTEDKSKDPLKSSVAEMLSKNERNEGYSLVSEVYVNDGYSFCSGGSSKSSCSNSSLDGGRISYEVVNEKRGRLTIQVKDSTKKASEFVSESENFEPDTLERKQRKSRLIQRIGGDEKEESERYSNQRFHDMDQNKKPDNSDNSENFTDSLERPTIMLKSNGSFKRNSLEKDVNELFRNLNWARMENFGSLREIYEAKSRHHKRRTETTSLIDSINSDNDCISTLSWGEERRNKLLHRGIILHIDEDVGVRRKGRSSQNKAFFSRNNSTEKAPSRPPKTGSMVPRSRSASPDTRSLISSSNRKKVKDPPTSPPSMHPPLTCHSPPLPPPRSLPVSPHLSHSCKARSITSSPVSSTDGGPASMQPALHSNNTIVRVCSKNECHAISSPLTSSGTQSVSFLSLSPPPPRPPKVPSFGSPPLPPRNSKPPLPPKSSKNKNKSNSSKFATRPLPPLPQPRSNKEVPSPTASYRDPDTLSTLSGASMDSLNSSEYESFYTMPYEEEDEGNAKDEACHVKNLKVSIQKPEFSRAASTDDAKHQLQQKNQRSQEPERKSGRGKTKAAHRLDDSGYLSTDSSESYGPQVVLPSQISKISEKGESVGGQNSETEESFCDGASESGAESTATDSFFYGNFKKADMMKTSSENSNSQTYPYSLRLSDVEVNSDTERHCVPIMVRP